MARPTDVPTSITGRRGYWRYLYGSHGWIPSTEGDFSRGMVRDMPRIDIPPGGVYDAADYLLHQPGLAKKRGGTAYAGPAMTAATYAQSVLYANIPGNATVLATGDNGHIYTVAGGTTTDLGGSTIATIEKPLLRVGGGKNLVIFTASNGTGSPVKWDGSAAPAGLGGTPPAGAYATIHKTRLVLGNQTASPQRIYFSPTPDIESTWDTANSWIDCDGPVTGLASLFNSLIVFTADHTERIVGTTPPPNSDMDRAPVGSIGCTDARSIVTQEGNVLFANPRGVYLTNGAGFASLTTEGLIESYWQSLFSGYSSSWTIAAGLLRGYYFVTILNASGTLVATLMCNVKRRAWWRLTNINASMYSSAINAQEELYYADRSTNRVVALSGIFNPSASNKNDANGTAVTPTIEFRAIGEGTGIKAYGFGRLNYDMRDAASDNPTMAVTVKTGVEASASSTPAESPLAETTNSDNTRKRFTIAKEGQAVTIALAQTNASSKTEIYALEVEARSAPLGQDGQ